MAKQSYYRAIDLHINMKNLIVSILLISILAIACSPKTYDSLEWQGTEIGIDGLINDWSNPLRFYDYKSKINYSISNDLKNIYLCIKISDRPTQMKILRAGMEIKIDSLGKNEFPVSFIYPIPNQNKGMNLRKPENESEIKLEDKQDRSQMMKRYLIEAKNAQLIGFKAELGNSISLLENTSGIHAAIHIDNGGIMCYEALIPFETFYKKSLSEADSNLVFNYEIKINALPAPSLSAGGGYNGGGNPSSISGRGLQTGARGPQGGGGGIPGAGGQGGNYNNIGYTEMYNANEIKMKLKFALGTKSAQIVP
jgi:hypothetical protein